MTKRRYGDADVREIFALAVASDARDPSVRARTGGLTLDELQRIGREAGIEPVRIAQAAERLDARGRSSVRRSFGLPIGVARLVDLPRAPTDRAWAQLISTLRTTFGVHGRTTTSSELREWSHGNLHVAIEPTAHGEQLRLSDLKDEAVAINGLGFMLCAMVVLMATVVAAAGQSRKALVILGLFGGMALLAFVGAKLVRTPAWAREREWQMEGIAEHAVKLLSDS